MEDGYSASGRNQQVSIVGEQSRERERKGMRNRRLCVDVDVAEEAYTRIFGSRVEFMSAVLHRDSTRLLVWIDSANTNLDFRMIWRDTVPIQTVRRP